MPFLFLIPILLLLVNDLIRNMLRGVHQIAIDLDRRSAANLQEIEATHVTSEIRPFIVAINQLLGRVAQSVSAQRRFVADAAHELRTPLAVLISETQTTLARERPAHEYRETVTVCLETAQQMRQLTESLLGLAQLEAGTPVSSPAAVDLALLVGESVQRLRPLVSSAELTMELQLATALVAGDRVQLGQVVTNLVTNAIHYNRTGGTIVVQTRTDDEGVLLEVEDTGRGIAREDLPHLFERFYRGDKSRSRAEGRYGLGLSITHAIVEAHGGAVTVESEEGRGSTFRVRFPRHRDEPRFPNVSS
jgi:signal transduction histidine kinase